MTITARFSERMVVFVRAWRPSGGAPADSSSVRVADAQTPAVGELSRGEHGCTRPSGRYGCRGQHDDGADAGEVRADDRPAGTEAVADPGTQLGPNKCADTSECVHQSQLERRQIELQEAVEQPAISSTAWAANQI